MGVFGKKIHELRKAKGMTLEELANRIDSCKGYISGIETCTRRPPSDKVVRKLAKIFGVNKKLLLRLAHIDKIPEDLRQELQNSTILTPKKVIDSLDGDLSTIIAEKEGRRKKSHVPFPAGYVPIINNEEGCFPGNFDEFQKLWENTSESIQFNLAGTSVAFGIRMPDSSMIRKRGVFFPQDSIVLFSPVKRLQSGSYIFVVYRTEHGLSTVFRFLKDCTRSKIHLIPLNSRYRKEIILTRRMIDSTWKAVARLDLIE